MPQLIPDARPDAAAPGRRARWLAGAAATLAGPLVYWPMVRPGWAPVGYDLYYYFEPLRQYLATAWAAGRIPLWNPTTFFGAPFLANLQTGALYPPNLLLFVLPPEQAIGWIILAHLALAGLGMYAYALVALRLRPAGSLVAALVYALGGYMDSHLGHLNQSNTLAWTPWLLLAVDRLVARPTARRTAATAALVALVLLAGHTQQAYFTFVMAAVVGALALWRRRRGPRRGLLLGLAGAAGSVALGLLLAAAQLAPTAELVGRSPRNGGLGLEFAGAFALPISGLVASQVPDYTFQQPTEYTGYAGIAALVLAAFAVAARWRRPRVWMLAGVAVLTLLVALGPHGRVYDAAYYLLPGFRLFRVPARVLLFSSTALCVLAGEGVLAAQQLARVLGRPAWRSRTLRAAGAAAVPVLGALALAAVFSRWTYPAAGPHVRLGLAETANLAGWLLAAAATAAVLAAVLAGRRRALWLLPAAVALELVAASAPTEARHPLPATVYGLPSTAAALVPTDLDHRYVSLVHGDYSLPPDATVSAAGLSPADAGRYEAFAAGRDWLAPDIGMTLPGATADGYDGGILPLQEYVDLRAAGLPPGASNESDYTIHLVTDRLSAAWLAGHGVSVVLASPDTDPCAGDCTIIRRTPHVVAWAVNAPATRARLENGEAHVVADSGETVTVSVSGPGRLVLADAWYPGWKAYAGSRELPIARAADGFSRQVEVPPGADRVVFRYEPVSVKVGAAGSALGLAALLVLLAWPYAVTRRSRPATASRKASGE